MTPPRIDPAFTRDVAKQLDRRRMRRRLLVWTALLAVAVVAAMYVTCGHGFGLGGAGPGSGDGPGPVKALTSPTHCAIRVSAAGITVDGKPMLRDEAVTACAAASGADVVITGDAREGEWTDLQAALQAARVTYVVVHRPAHP
jgi:hypothetical protein